MLANKIIGRVAASILAQRLGEFLFPPTEPVTRSTPNLAAARALLAVA